MECRKDFVFNRDDRLNLAGYDRCRVIAARCSADVRVVHQRVPTARSRRSLPFALPRCSPRYCARFSAKSSVISRREAREMGRIGRTREGPKNSRVPRQRATARERWRPPPRRRAAKSRIHGAYGAYVTEGFRRRSGGAARGRKWPTGLR